MRPDAEKFYAYVRGWNDGAGRKAMRPEYSAGMLSVVYNEGYRAGQEAGRAVAAAAAKRFNYSPSKVHPT